MSLLLNAIESWDFCFDPENTGLVSKWFLHQPSHTKKVNVPHFWIDETENPAEHIGYYFKTFQVSKKESQRRFFLRFENVPHKLQAWLNGIEIGQHLGGHAPFDLDASNVIKIGEDNILTLRVEAPNAEGLLEDRQVDELSLGSIYKQVPYAGVLGPVHFLMAGRAGIEYLSAFPDYEADRITLEIKLWNPKNFKAELEISLTDPEGRTDTLPKQIKLEKENASYSITLHINNVKIWTPETPFLYTATVNLRGSYEMSCKFGMRRVEVERCQFKINHNMVKLRGITYHQPFLKYGVKAPFPFDLREDLKNIKEAGFNLIRSQGFPLSHQALGICDELGLLVIQESLCFNQRSNKTSLEELKELLRSTIMSQGYHPCIIAWGIGAENGSMTLENGNKLLRYTAEIDPYRPILSNLNSVEIDSNGVGKIDIGKVYDPTEQKIDPYESHKFNIAVPLSAKSQQLLGQYCSASKDAKAVNDNIHGNKSFWERYNYLKEELGGKILADILACGSPRELFQNLEDPRTKSLKDVSLQNAKEFKQQLQSAVDSSEAFESFEQFLNEIEELRISGMFDHMEAVLTNTQFTGYMYRNWADFDLNYTGIVNIFREKKPWFEKIKEANAPIKILSTPECRTPYTGTSAAIDINLWNETELADYNLLVRVKGPNNRIWHQESMTGQCKRGLSNVGRYKFPVGMEHGRFTFDLTLFEGKKELAKKEETFFVSPTVKIDDTLKLVRFEGKFSESLTYSQNSQSKIIVANQISSLGAPTLSHLLEEVNEGKVLVLNSLTQADVETLAQTNQLPGAVSVFRGRWAPLGSFHYAKNHPIFEGLPRGLLSEVYADILPVWALELTDSSAEIISGGIHCHFKNLGESKVKHGINMAKIPLGKGSVVFCQFDLSEHLGKNALLDVLFVQMVKNLLK